ncbi:MAG: desulfoferrodoxin family protein [Thiomonas sp.]|jgi:superoxide reductase
MQRRTFVTTALAGAASTVALPRLAQAAPGEEWTNVVFTESDPGHWKDVEKLHVPQVKIDGRKLTVTTPHPMSEAHYIVSHTVVLEGGKFLDRKTFNWKDQPTSEHTLPDGYKGKVTVTSTCNLHDWWVKSVTA